MIPLRVNQREAFAKAFLLFLAFFIALNFAIWKFRTEALFDIHYDGGDLARLGYVAGSKHFRTNCDDLPVRHVDIDDYRGQRVDLVTIGDSFSQGMGGGKNRFYQDYIASRNNLTVLNVRPYEPFGALSTLIILLNNGVLDRIRPRYVILESAEKHCIERFAGTVDFDANMSMQSLGKFTSTKYGKLDFRLSFINNGNLKYLLYNALRLISPNGFFLRTYLVELNKPCFSVDNEDKLLFYDHDIKRIAGSNDATVAALNANLNTLSDRLGKRNIRLYFMPIVDKYNLYSDYIVENSYPRSVFFEKLRKQPRKYALIDTKALLAPEVRKGERDIYYADDTHWGWKASETIFRTVRFR
ncbi:hypothetical protein EG829_01470 [bacterium]|nr:hypothetical protein [bacterium]